jgi:hypothetical protein
MLRETRRMRRRRRRLKRRIRVPPLGGWHLA